MFCFACLFVLFRKDFVTKLTKSHVSVTVPVGKRASLSHGHGNGKIRVKNQSEIKANKVIVHPDKFKFIIFHPSCKQINSSELNTFINNTSIARVKEHKFLGIIIPGNLLWKPHIITYYKNSTDNLKILSWSSSIHLGEGLNIHRSIYCHQLFPLFVKSNLNHSWRTSMLIGSGSCSGSLKIKIKIKRRKRPCPYYANTVATLHVVLDVSDLVFKLNPGPENNRIATIISSRSSTNYRCRSEVKGCQPRKLKISKAC